MKTISTRFTQSPFSSSSLFFPSIRYNPQGSLSALPPSITTSTHFALTTTNKGKGNGNSTTQCFRHNNNKNNRSAILATLAAAMAMAMGMGGSEPAQAVPVEKIVSLIYEAQDASQQVSEVVANAYTVTKVLFEQIYITVKPAFDTAVPYIEKATNTAIHVASPIVSDIVTQADSVLISAGIDTHPVVEVAKIAVGVVGEAIEKVEKVFEGENPIANSAMHTISTSDPLILAEGSGGLTLLYTLAPFFTSAFAYATRGYKGDLSAPRALDLILNEDYILIDIRSEKEKFKSGIASLPTNARKRVLFVPLEDFHTKLRDELRNSKKLEAEVAAMKISYLKGVKRGSNLVILDSFGDTSKIAARYLTKSGLMNVWVLNDGFDGGKGWLQTRLGVDSYNISKAEIILPSKIIPFSKNKSLE